MQRLFGTDGVRGVANIDLTPELSFALGRAAGAVLASRNPINDGGRPRLLIGRDTRASGPMLEAALAAGANSVGVDCDLGGVLPTPAVAFLARAKGYDAAVVISASHNPVEDNGIKFFSSGGFKLSDDEEAEIEKAVEAVRGGDDRLPRPTGAQVGSQREATRLAGEYVDFLCRAFPLDLSGVTIAVDCANGAASKIAPAVLKRLGADVVVLNAEPNGANINVECGSTHPHVIAEAVESGKATIGFAFDGDADRLQAVDEGGRVIDGDHILAILASDMMERGTLKNAKIAATTYSNLGLKIALEALGASVVETPAGDRYVLEAMRREDLVLGGEQSGHIILLEHNTTGDGLLTGLALLDVLVRSGKSLRELAQVMKALPQVLENVRVSDKTAINGNEAIRRAIAQAQAALGTNGRIFVRASGTEPVIRVMGEGQDERVVRQVVTQVVEAIQAELGDG